MGRRTGWTAKSLASGVLLGLVVVPALASGGQDASEATTGSRAVIVQATSPAEVARAAKSVTRVGGRVTTPLPIVDGFAAQVPSIAVRRLASAPGVRVVTPNEPVAVMATETSPLEDDFEPIKSVYRAEVNAPRLNAEGVTGEAAGGRRQVRVALIDTGVSAVPGIADRIVPVADWRRADAGSLPCVDLSGSAKLCEDEYGHGTFIAGLIAGTGTSAIDRNRGVAPGAGIVSIKIAGRDGSSDVTKVLAAIQWVVSFAERYNIKVLNLSLGTDSKAPPTTDPLNFAVQRAWVSGITVVVSASNRGADPGTISKPGDDPLAITVGATDDRETPAVSDDRVPDYSARGPAGAPAFLVDKPDVVAPGSRLVSLRAPGSAVEALVVPPTLLEGTPYRRGSGTSMSAGVVSGAVALVSAARPDWSPNRIKFALTSTARKVALSDPAAVGAGLVDAWAAARVAPYGFANGNIQSVLSSGTGSLDDARGAMRVDEPPCSTIEALLDPGCADGVTAGAETAQGRVFDAKDYQGTWDGTSWYESQWAGTSWYGTSWYGTSWYEGDFSGSSGDGAREEHGYGTALAGTSWYGAWE